MKRLWRDKLHPDCLSLLDAYRELGGICTVEDFHEWVEAVGIPREQEGLPNLLPTCVRIRMLLLELEQMIPEIWHSLAGKGLNLSRDLTALSLRHRLTQLVKVLRKMEFGSQPLDEAQKRALAAQCFELCARLCRGQVVPPMGRQDSERADLVDFIRGHQKEQLTWEELREALMHAGAHVREDPEALRLWVWRAEKRGLVRPRSKEKKVLRLQR